MNLDIDYKKAYERQKLAREKAEQLLESKSRALFETNESLNRAYEKLKNEKAKTLHQEKLASLGQLVAGIAHEINNPNAFIKSNLSSLKGYQVSLFAMLEDIKKVVEFCDDGRSACDLGASILTIFKDNDLDYILTDLEDVIEESIEGAQRVENIVLSLKNFSRKDSEKPERLYINQCIENTLNLVASEVKYKADLILNLGDVPPVNGFSGAMGQVFLNLIVNASQAIDEFGSITISTSVEDKYVKIVIADTGEGIDQVHIEKIFDPFFTTKDVGVGTGLGLSIVHGVIEKHKGTIDVESVQGEGTAFTIGLPL